jgi:hypothetical protein
MCSASKGQLKTRLQLGYEAFLPPSLVAEEQDIALNRAMEEAFC